ncbi:hypothetical protein DFQ26_003409 [Actinomortierella ambigua]|nr:hypothetical protein DFQ26_003409 [Actinomortierella ambigua]
MPTASLKIPTMSLVGLRRAIERFIYNRKRSPLEYMVLATVAAFLSALIRYPDRAIFTRARPDLKNNTPPGYPLLGHLPTLLRRPEDPYNTLHQGMRYFGNKMSMTLPIIGRMIIVNDAASMEYILKTNMENYIKGRVFAFNMSDLLGRGIFVSDGQKWKFHRKTASNIFTTRLYRELVQGAFKRSALELGAAFERYMDRGQLIDLQNEFLKLTLDAFGRLTFGLEFNAVSTEGTNEFGDAFDFMTAMIDMRVQNPFWFITDRFVPGRTGRIREAIATIDRYAAKAIQSRRAETPVAREQRPKDLLDHFINYQNGDGTMLSDVDLRDVFTNFMIAGRDTTAQGLTWAFYLLMTHPRVMANLLQEVMAVCGDNVEGLTYEMVTQDMPYAKAVFYETLRLYPPVPKNGKEAVDEDVLPDGTRVFKGDILVYSNYTLGRNLTLWGVDAERFYPERWLKEQDEEMVVVEEVDGKGRSPFGKFKNESTFKFNSFNAGPRICLGQTFATLEALVTMAYLVRRYEFRMAPDHPIALPKPSVTLPMQQPLLVQVSRRGDVVCL